ncbi:MAG: hypothetical protein IKI29_00790 [Clostridia bacterium]|nr:hypothetical protein [Clostridia bacterium]
MRADGKRLKNTDPMYTVAAHIMNRRTDALNMATIDIPIDTAQNYLNAKRKEGVNISHMALFLAAYLRTVCDFPELNRFVVNKRIYAHNDFWVSLVVLKSGQDHEGTTSKVKLELTDTVFDVTRKMEKYIDENRHAAENNGTEKMIKFLLSVPGVLGLGVGVFRFMDKHGLLPRSILSISPFHNSLFISNLASIRTNHIYHHCYEFGTTSIFVTLGNLREVPRRVKGEIVFERCLPLGVVMDERICSGSYFASAFRRLRHLMLHPELLEVPPEKVTKDPCF